MAQDYDSFLDNFVAQHSNSAVGSVVTQTEDDDPDRAARALELSRSSGVPAEAIYPNLDQFETQHKAVLNSDVIMGNPHLQDYLNSRPMAAKVSGDDIGPLDEAIRAVRNFVGGPWHPNPEKYALDPDERVHDQQDRAFNKGYWEGFGDQPIGDWINWKTVDGKAVRNTDFAQGYPVSTALITGGLAVPEFMLRGFNGIIHGATEYMYKRIQEGADSVGLNGDLLARDLAAMAETEAMGMSGRHPVTSPETIELIKPMISAIKPWIEAGKEPPFGVNLLYDSIRKAEIEYDAKNLDDAVAAMDKTGTKARDPEHAGFAAEGAAEGRTIGVDAEAIDRLPDSVKEDLAKWIPDLDAQIESGVGPGGFVNIPVKDWVANIDKDLHKELRPYIQFRKNGPTLDELAQVVEKAKISAPTEPTEPTPADSVTEGQEPTPPVPAQPQGPIPNPVQLVRHSGGLEPMYAVGDRKLTIQKRALKKGEKELGEKDPLGRGVDHFQVLDQDGTPIGYLDVTPLEGGTKIWIANTGGFESKGYSSNSFGPALIAHALEQLKREYPQMKEIGGYRVSGAREKAGTERMIWRDVQQTIQDPETMHHVRTLFSSEDFDRQLATIDKMHSVWLRPPEDWSAHEHEIANAIQEEMRKIAPQATSRVVTSIHAPDVEARGGRIEAIYDPRQDQAVFSLMSQDPIGDVWHEGIHQLRRGFFTDEEWNTLKAASLAEGWHSKYNISRFYSHRHPEIQIEEAVAEHFRTWMKDKSTPTPQAVRTIFQKMADLFKALLQHISKILDRPVTWDEIFGKVEAGEVGARQRRDRVAGTEYALQGEREPRATIKDEAALKAANDPDAFGRSKFPSYEAAVKNQAIKDVVDKDTHVGDLQYWKDKAEKENITYVAQLRPNAFDAARRYSEGGKTTMLIRNDGRRVVFKNGELLVSERREGPPTALASIKEEPPEGPEPVQIRPPFARGKSIGITQKLYNQYMKLIQSRHEADLKYDFLKEQKLETKKQTREWKENRVQVRDQVRQETQRRPDIMLNQLFANHGLKLHPDFLTDEQKAALPRDAMQKKNGINPDVLAPELGYSTGQEMVNHFIELTNDRAKSGMNAKEYFNDLVDKETDRRMEQQFGFLQRNILEEAKDRALSKNQMDMLHHEILMAAELSHQGLPIDRDTIDEQEWTKFQQLINGKLDSDQFLRASRLAGERALQHAMDGDFQESLKEKQKQYLATLNAKFTHDLEKARKKFDKSTKSLRKKEPTNIEPEWVNWIHDILERTGYKPNRLREHIDESIARRGGGTIDDFLDEYNKSQYNLTDVPVADFLADPNFRKDVDDMTVNEFYGLKFSIDALAKVARDINYVRVRGEVGEKVKLRDQMIAQLETFPEKKIKWDEAEMKLSRMPKTWLAGSTAIETLLNRWDRDDPYGVFNRFVVYPLAAAANNKSRMIREYARRYGEAAGVLDNPDGLIPSPFIDPMSRTNHNPDGVPFERFTRRQGMAILYNLGNESNLRILAGGYAVNKDALLDWARTHMTEQDWDRAQRVGDLYRELISHADDVYENMYGWPIEKIPLKPVKGPGGKMYKGWYYPAMKDPTYKVVWKQDAETGIWSGREAPPKKDIYDDSDFFHLSTSNGYTKRRTGAVYPIDLNPDMAPIRMTQMIHDISFREPITEVNKLIGNEIFLNSVRKHYGTTYADLIKPYLQALAGHEGFNSKAYAQAVWLSETIRSNVIGTYIGFNPSTPIKHGPTAWVMSMRGVGPLNFLAAVREAWAQAPSLAAERRKFAMDNSEELQRRERHWLDSFGAQQEVINAQMNLRGKVAFYGSKAVAFSDKLSAIPTWLAAYDRALAETSGDKLLSVQVADAAVRKAHGSTAETNKPALVRGDGVLHNWMTSVYGFFGTVMQRRIEIAHKAADFWRMGIKEGDWNYAMKKSNEIAWDTLAYVIWPTAIEEWVTGMFTEDNKGLLEHLLYGGLLGMASGALYARDITQALIRGQPPGAGLLQGPLGDIGHVLNDFRKGGEAFDAEHAGSTVQHALTLFGDISGLMPKTAANAAKFGIDLYNEQARPEGYDEWLRGLARGKPEKTQSH